MKEELARCADRSGSTEHPPKKETRVLFSTWCRGTSKRPLVRRSVNERRSVYVFRKA